MDITQERADFEAFASKHGLCVTEEGDLYRSHVVAWMWKAWQARASLQSQDREDALTKLVAACPTNLRCDDFHHTKADRHASNEACPPLARYLAAIGHARRIEGGGE